MYTAIQRKRKKKGMGWNGRNDGEWGIELEW